MPDRVAMVTGGGGGIGSEVALELSRRGITVVVVDPGVSVEGEPVGADTAAQTVRRIEAEGGTAVASTVSITDGAALTALVEETVQRYGSLDVVVNAAGIIRFPSIDRATEDDWSALVDVHLGGYLCLLAAALPVMAAAGHGGVVGLTSGVGLARTSVGGPGYGAAKRAVAALTWQLGRVTPAGVTVNALSPIAATRMVRAGLLAGGAGPGDLDLTAMPQAAEMAPMAVHLAGERSGWCSGQVVFSAGSEFSLVDPPRLLEAMGTDGGPGAAVALATVVPEVLVPAEGLQRTTGGANPRFGRLSGAPPAPPPGPGSRCLVVGRAAATTAALEAALTAWGCEVVSGAEPGADFSSAVAVLRAAGPVDAIVVVGAEPGTPPAGDPPTWREVLDSHAGVVRDLHVHAGWQHAAVQAPAAGGVPRRVVHVVPAATPADGRPPRPSSNWSARRTTRPPCRHGPSPSAWRRPPRPIPARWHSWWPGSSPPPTSSPWRVRSWSSGAAGWACGPIRRRARPSRWPAAFRAVGSPTRFAKRTGSESPTDARRRRGTAAGTDQAGRSGSPLTPDACCRIQACIAMPAATPALIDRVEPYCAIDRTPSARSRAASLRPVPSWPNSSTQARGSGSVSSGRAPGRLSTASSGSPSARAQAANAATSGEWCTCR